MRTTSVYPAALLDQPFLCASYALRPTYKSYSDASGRYTRDEPSARHAALRSSFVCEPIVRNEFASFPSACLGI